MYKLFIFCWIFFIITACNNVVKNNEVPNADTSNIDTATQLTDTIGSGNKIPVDSEKTESNPLIVAGESVGKISLGADASTLENILGKPDMSDAAMGKAWLTWYGKKPDEHNNKTKLDIYTTYKDTSMREQTVQQIRTTSSFFITTDSLHVYSSLDEIKKKYTVKKAAQYNSEERPVILYDDKQDGIAFEIASANTQSICIGIIVHAKNKSVNDIYIMLHPDMKRLDK